MMDKLLSNTFLSALLFSVYQALAFYLLDVPAFKREDVSVFYFVLLLTGSFIVFYLALWIVQQFLMRKKTDIFLLVALTYVISAVLVAFIFRSLMQPGFEWVLILSVLVISIFPLAIVFWSYLLKQLENRLSVTVLSNESSSEIGAKRIKDIVISNPSGKVIFHSAANHVVAFEANDNYVMIHFLKENEPSKQLERVSLKKIESLLDKNDVHFFRVHKSFIINPLFLIEVLGNVQSQKIRLEHLSDEVPVSRQFDVSVLENHLKNA